QRQRSAPPIGGEQRDASPEQDWDDCDLDPIYLAGGEQASKECSAAVQPDLATRRLTKFGDRRHRVVGDDSDARVIGGTEGSGKDKHARTDGPGRRCGGAEDDLVAVPTQEYRVDVLE